MSNVKGLFFIAWTSQHCAVANDRETAVDALSEAYDGDLPPYRVAEIEAILPAVEITEKGVSLALPSAAGGKLSLTLVK